MNKFLIILRKELKELITVQTLVPLVLILVMFYFMGDFIKSFTGDTSIEISSEDIQMAEQGEESENFIERDTGEKITVSKNSIIGLIDNEKSEMSNYISGMLGQYGLVTVTPSSSDPVEACRELLEYELDGNKVEVKTLVVLNQGIEESINNSAPVPIDIYSSVTTFGVLNSAMSASSSNISGVINTIVSDKLISDYMSGSSVNINYLNFPTYERSYTYMNGEAAQINSGVILGYITSNTAFVPIIVFIIIMSATQTLASSVVNEKSDKTLETLMTTPVNRMTVLFAKILAAAIYAILYAVVYVFSFRNYMDSLSGGGAFSPEMLKVIEDFGISFNLATLLMIGVQLFLSVLCGLGIALIIGIMVEDVKTLQAYIVPILVVIMIPYLVSMLIDINTLPAIFKILIYAIPFTHTFAAATNIFTQNYLLLTAGIIYQVIFVIAMMTIAIKIFNSDKLITLSEIIKSKSAKKKGGIFGLKK